MYSSSWEEAKASYKFTVSPITESNLLQRSRITIKTLQDALRDMYKLEWLSELKEGEKQQRTIPIEDTQELVRDLMLKVVLYLMNWNYCQQ
jgi:hypothetical protein